MKRRATGGSDHGNETCGGTQRLLVRQFLEEEGIREQVETTAVKRVLAWQFEQEMIRQQKTKQSMAKELKTSRSQLDRLLDPQNTAVSLDTLARAAHVLGKRLVLEIRDQQPAVRRRKRQTTVA